MRTTPSRDFEIEALKEEVRDLWAELRQLRREVRYLRGSDESDSRDARRPRDSEQGCTSQTSYSPGLERSRSGSEQSVLRQSLREVDEENEQSLPVPPLPSSSITDTNTSLTWLQREAICDEIGLFLHRCITGNYRGTSNRSKIPLPSRLWIIVRDYAGQIYSPVKVVKTWASAKVLCKPNNHECGDSVFVGIPSEREARRVVQAAGLQFPSVIEQ